MASICKRRGSAKWLINFKDEHGLWRTVTGYTDKALTKKKAELLEFDAERRRRGAVDVVKDALPLSEQIAAYERFLSNRSPVYVAITISRVKAFEFDSVAQIVGPLASEKASEFLKSIPGNGSNRNHYLTAIKMFCRWLHRHRNLPLSPICHLKKELVKKATIDRRAATEKEIQKLLKNLRGTVNTLTAEQRYYLYLTALETGFRAEELSTLDANDFHGRIVRCTETKNGKAVDQPVTENYARIMRQWLANRTGKVWPGKWYRRAAKMLFNDLRSAKLPIRTVDGVLDFHALRVTFVTNLVRDGLPAKQVQMLARHSTMELTMKVYAKLGIEEVAQDRRSKIYVRLCPLASAQVQSNNGQRNGFSKRKTA
jgi:integrase